MFVFSEKNEISYNKNFFDYLVDGVKENQLYLINIKYQKKIRKMVVYFFLL